VMGFSFLDIPATEWIASNELAFAIRDRYPVSKGHTLVIPRTHVADLWQVSAPLSAALASAVIRVGRAIDRALNPEGMNLITSAGATAEQTVFHLHLHVVPRWHADGFGAIWPRDHRYENADLTDVAGRIRLACESD